MHWLDLAFAIPIAGLLVVLNALFSGTEVAVFSLRRVDRDQMSKSGRPADKSVLALLALPRRLITAVLIGIESLVGLLVVVILGVVALVWPQLASSPWLHAGATLAIALPLIVLFGEVMPKTLALKNPIAWSRVAAWPLAMFALAISPVRWIVQGASALLLRPFGDSARSRPTRDLSEEEFKSLIDAGSAEGQVDARERRLIHRVFDFADKNVGQIMTPRDRMFALAYDLPMARLAKEVAARGFSRVPIYQKNLDNVRGILNAKDLIRVRAGSTGDRTLGEILHEPLFVPRTTPVKRLFVTFKQKKVHMGVVVNEYGKVLGLVTMDDVLAQLFGALRDERDALQTATEHRRGRGGRTPIPGVPITPLAQGAAAFETGPVGRVDPSELTPPPRDPADLTPPELTPVPHDVPFTGTRSKPVSRQITALEDEPGPTRDREGTGGSVEPSRRLRASTKDEDDAEDARGDREGNGHNGDARSGERGDGTPVPITDNDTGPSGPIPVGGRR